jgi:FtsP/CotA-like multicopper oxidase with cupredoxin domain
VAVGAAGAQDAPGARARVVPNDNRRPAGRTEGGERVVRLVARMAEWHPGGDERPSLPWPVFAEEGGPPTSPGPLVRVTTGTPVRATIRNGIARPIAVFGLGATRGASGDSLLIAPGEVAETRFVAGAPGLHYYLARTQPAHYPGGTFEGSLHGALVIDSAGATGEPRDRILVIAGAGLEDSSTVSGLTPNTALTINGVEWPHTERFDVAQGDTLRWRWVNLTDLDHPMHLHGFHFRVDARGDGVRDTALAPARRWLAVTERVAPGATLATTWSPERPGNWIFHCHLASHMAPQRVLDTPLAERGVAHAGHGPRGPGLGHAMAGLVLGIRVRPAAAAAPADMRAARPIRLLVRSRPRTLGELPGYAYVLGGSAAEGDPAAMPVPGPTLVLTRGEPVAVTIVNRSHEPAAVHWHGIELESFPDGVPGWSGEGERILPAIAPGDSLTVRFTPPRAGTFMYHSHFNEGQQIASGLYGPIVVLAPGERWDPATDRVLVFSDAAPFVNFVRDPAPPILINGRLAPPPLELRAGTTYRLRLVNIPAEFDTRVALLDGDVPVRWRLVAKDGATLPAHLATERPAELRFFPGEIHDYTFTPERRGELTLRVWRRSRAKADTRVPVRVR